MTALSRYGPRRAEGQPDAVVYVGLGANVGDRLAALRTAAARLADHTFAHDVAASAVYETEAHVLPGQLPQPDHLNAVLRFRTRATLYMVFDTMRWAETSLGRRPGLPWAPRPIDLDLLLYDDEVMESRPDRGDMVPDIVLPHPRIAGRRFVLAPLADLAPGLVVPGTGRTVADLLVACPDRARIARTPFSIWPPDPPDR